MKNEQPTTSSITVVSSHVIALPIALYELNGVIYQLYQGGQPYQPMVIRWQRLKTMTVTREGDGMADVHIRQGQPQHGTGQR